MKTTDFSGPYDYEAEEAGGVASIIAEDIRDGYIETIEELSQRVEGEIKHWAKFDGLDMVTFGRVFDSIVEPIARAKFGDCPNSCRFSV
jgi:hypothetical protein